MAAVGVQRAAAGRRLAPPWPRNPAAAWAPSAPAASSTAQAGARSFAEKARKSVYRPFESIKPAHKQAKENSPEILMQAQMYTPEALQSEALVRNCFRMVAYGLASPDLLDRYGARAAELSAGMKPSQFSVLLNSFARAEHRHEQMLRSFTRRMPPRLPRFVPKDISQVCHAYSKLRERDEGLFRRFSAEMPHKLPLFEGHELSKVANAYARLSMRDDLLFDDIADEIIRRPQELDAAALVLAANAFGHFRISHPRLWLVLSEWLLHSCLDLEAKDVAVLLNAFGAVGFHHEALLRALVHSLGEEPLLGEVEPGSLALALNALARLQWPGEAGSAGVEEPLRRLAERAADTAGELGCIGAAQLLHACAQLRALRSDGRLLEGVLARARGVVSEMNAQSLSMVVNACAKMRHRDVALLTQVAKAVTPHLKDFTPQALAVLAHGFAKLEVRSEILFYLLAGEMVDKMPLFSAQGLGMILRAYGRLQIHNERLVQASRRQLRALAEELTLPELQAIEAGLGELGALDSSTEALLRRHRGRLALERAAGQAAPQAGAADPWAAAPGAEEERGLLARAAQEEDDAQAVREVAWGPAVEGQQPAPREPPADAASRPAEDAGREQEERDEDPDLWSLWNVGAPGPRSGGVGAEGAAESPGMGADAGSATPPSRLREYLARPARLGRRAVDVSPAARRPQEAAGAPTSAGRSGGRRRGRRGPS